MNNSLNDGRVNFFRRCGRNRDVARSSAAGRPPSGRNARRPRNGSVGSGFSASNSCGFFGSDSGFRGRPVNAGTDACRGFLFRSVASGRGPRGGAARRSSGFDDATRIRWRPQQQGSVPLLPSTPIRPGPSGSSPSVFRPDGVLNAVSSPSVGRARTSSNSSLTTSNSPSGNRTIPGFLWDPERLRYFRVLPDQYRGCSRFITTDDELKIERRQQEEASLNRPFSGMHLQSSNSKPGHAADANGHRSLKPLPRTAASQQCPPEGPPLAQLMIGQEYGMANREQMKRVASESRWRRMGTTGPPLKLKIFDYPDETLENCQFLDDCSDGRTILGVWTIRERPWTRIMCLNVKVDHRKVTESSYGLQMAPTDNYIYVMERNAVDFCRAQMNSGVTCTLHITIPSRSTGSRVFLQPIPELSSVSNPEYLNSSMYNAHWGMTESAFSCTWDTNRMRVCLGMEKYGMILEALNGSGFKLWSKNRHVLAPKFSKNGNLIFMGIRGSDIICSDLRRPCNRAIYTLPQTSSCSITLFADDRYMIASSLTGELKIWDLRMRKTVFFFNQHRNSHWKLPVLLDDTETVTFAVGEDGVTRGWSVRTGEFLCAVPPPYPIVSRDLVPRICCSNSWGGLYGNLGLCLAVRDEMHVYELKA